MSESKPELPSIYKWASPKDGEFRRQVSSFRDHISSAPEARFEPEANRFHLYASYACPWASRVMIVRALKGLDKVIGLSIVDYFLGEDGWRFNPQVPGGTPDEVNGASLLKDIYFKANPEYSGRFTVPVLWDKKHKTIVNNESSEIIRMLNTNFDEWSSKPGLTFYPDDLAPQIDEINSWIYDGINNGVYKCGFATTQTAYDHNCRTLFESLDKVENILCQNTWLVGNRLTEADIRLFTTILRFDPVYHTHFKCNLKTISHDYPNILRWARQFVQTNPEAKETVNMEHIKGHYYTSHININPNQIVPLWNGPDLYNFPYNESINAV
ncbi:glutathione transferase [Synchytrium endobioticum]|uniref:Glutathione transferase n=1 Tax=Synchytrium endobioticum TaxID=286115 RepID=A0A507CPD5_9FUNG|nr:glutathione transferase [Synchytrium endobioticum]TPX46289.1 glutathione transferase [Synchytrium endobioticum]